MEAARTVRLRPRGDPADLGQRDPRPVGRARRTVPVPLDRPQAAPDSRVQGAGRGQAQGRPQVAGRPGAPGRHRHPDRREGARQEGLGRAVLGRQARHPRRRPVLPGPGTRVLRRGRGGRHSHTGEGPRRRPRRQRREQRLRFIARPPAGLVVRAGRPDRRRPQAPRPHESGEAEQPRVRRGVHELPAGQRWHRVGQRNDPLERPDRSDSRPAVRAVRPRVDEVVEPVRRARNGTATQGRHAAGDEGDDARDDGLGHRGHAHPAARRDAQDEGRQARRADRRQEPARPRTRRRAGEPGRIDARHEKRDRHGFDEPQGHARGAQTGHGPRRRVGRQAPQRRVRPGGRAAGRAGRRQARTGRRRGRRAHQTARRKPARSAAARGQAEQPAAGRRPAERARLAGRPGVPEARPPRRRRREARRARARRGQAPVGRQDGGRGPSRVGPNRRRPQGPAGRRGEVGGTRRLGDAEAGPQEIDGRPGRRDPRPFDTGHSGRGTEGRTVPRRGRGRRRADLLRPDDHLAGETFRAIDPGRSRQRHRRTLDRAVRAGVRGRQARRRQRPDEVFPPGHPGRRPARPARRPAQRRQPQRRQQLPPGDRRRHAIPRPGFVRPYRPDLRGRRAGRPGPPLGRKEGAAGGRVRRHRRGRFPRVAAGRSRADVQFAAGRPGVHHGQRRQQLDADHEPAAGGLQPRRGGSGDGRATRLAGRRVGARPGLEGEARKPPRPAAGRRDRAVAPLPTRRQAGRLPRRRSHAQELRREDRHRQFRGHRRHGDDGGDRRAG